jgi:phage I-like protein
MSGPMSRRTSLLGTCAHAVDLAVTGDSEPKKRVQLLPMGKIVGRDGRGPYILADLAHAQEVVASSLAAAGSTQIPIDYDHQIPFGVRDGVAAQAPASGWITGLTAEADGIWASVEWTEAATAKIKAREYRYISPFFSFTRETGRVTRIWNAGLLNWPNFTELSAVAAAETTGDTMDLKALAKALGLADDATMEEILAGVTALKTAKDKAETAAAAAAANPDPARFVPMAAFTELRGEVAALRTADTEEKATAAVDTAVREGKITPAGREHALSLYKADPTAFAAFVGTAPVVINPGTVAAAARVNLDAPLTDVERKSARIIGVSEEAFLASKKQILGA